MRTLTMQDYTPDRPEQKKIGLTDPNWCAPSGWPRLQGLLSMRDHGGGEKLMRQLRGKRKHNGPMAKLSGRTKC